MAGSRKVELLVARWYEPCRQAEAVWRAVVAEQGDTLNVLDIDAPEGQALMARHKLKAIPAVFINGELVAVGVQDRPHALELLEIAPE